MTKKPFTFLILLTSTVGLMALLRDDGQMSRTTEVSSGTQPNLIIPSRKTTPQLPTTLRATSREPASAGYVNRPSSTWEEKLHSTLTEQGGTSLKDIKVVKERSFIWARDKISLHVESVIITLKNTQNIESSFRAIIDSETGKVLETWDRSIFDPADVRGGVQIKLDAKYTN